MYASLPFWFALAIPGYVIIRLFCKDELESGLLGTFGLSYVAVLGVLTPVSLVCYWFELPVGVFSAACVLLVLASLFEITRRKWWFDLAKLGVAALSIELLIILVDAIMGARTGGFLGGDSRVHLARVRFLLDHGFCNYDPYVGAPSFFPTYHTNILHALYAACSQITSVHYIDAWYASLGWGKVMIASGAYYMAWCVFGNRWAAWAAAVCVVATYAPIPFVIYPNKLAPLWLVPCMIGVAVRLLDRHLGWQGVALLGIGSLLLGQAHGLYAGFAAVLFLPLLAGAALWHLLRDRRHWIKPSVAALAVTIGVAFPMTSRAHSRPKEPRASTQQVTVESQSSDFIRFENGWKMVNLNPQGQWWRKIIQLGAIGIALLTCRRKQVAFVVAIEVVAIAILYAPPLCTMAIHYLGAEWVVSRLGFAISVSTLILLPGAVTLLLANRFKNRWAQSLISVVLFVAAAFHGATSDYYSWKNYGIAIKAKVNKQKQSLNYFHQIQPFLTKHIPEGSAVLAEADYGMWLVLLHDCYIVAAKSSQNGVNDLTERRADLAVLLAPGTPWIDRLNLLNKYGVSYQASSATSRPQPWVEDHRLDSWQTTGLTISRLKLD